MKVKNLKSLGPIDRKFHLHGKNDGFVLYEYIMKQCSTCCKYTNISVMKKRSKKIICQQYTESTSCLWVTHSFVSHFFGLAPSKHS